MGIKKKTSLSLTDKSIARIAALKKALPYKDMGEIVNEAIEIMALKYNVIIPETVSANQ